MVNFKKVLKIKLLVIVLFFCECQVSMAENCPTIDFNSLACGSLGSTVTYEVNYDNVKYIAWYVEGGEIIQIGDDYSAQAFGQSFCQSVNYDWSQASNFTSICYERTNTGSARFFDNFTQTVMELSQPGNSKFNYNFAKKLQFVGIIMELPKN